MACTPILPLKQQCLLKTKVVSVCHLPQPCSNSVQPCTAIIYIPLILKNSFQVFWIGLRVAPCGLHPHFTRKITIFIENQSGKCLPSAATLTIQCQTLHNNYLHAIISEGWFSGVLDRSQGGTIWPAPPFYP
jgi:hypothetical protein